MTARLYSLVFQAGGVFLDFFPYLRNCSSLTKKEGHAQQSQDTVASCPHLIANRVAVVLLGPPRRFLFLCLLTVPWVNMGQALNNFKAHLSRTKSVIVSVFWVTKTMSAGLTWQLRLSCKSSSPPHTHTPPPSLPRIVKGKSLRCLSDTRRRSLGASPLMATREVRFRSQRHAKLSGARLHGAPFHRQTVTPLPPLDSRWCVSHTYTHTLHRRLCFFSVDSLLCLSPKLRQQRCRYGNTQTNHSRQDTFWPKRLVKNIIYSWVHIICEIVCICLSSFIIGV